jgi:hypothetical protein
MPVIDPTYEPRPWRCDECGIILGVVLRGSNRVRTLYVFRRPNPGAVPEKDILFLAASDCYSERQEAGELFREYDMFHGTVECGDCHALTTWHMSQEMLVELLLERYKP